MTLSIDYSFALHIPDRYLLDVLRPKKTILDSYNPTDPELSSDPILYLYFYANFYLIRQIYANFHANFYDFFL